MLPRIDLPEVVLEVMGWENRAPSRRSRPARAVGLGWPI